MKIKKLRKRNKVFISGSDGFIGRNLVNQLSKQYEVLSPKKKELNLINIKLLNEYLKTHKPDFIIHLASTTVINTKNKRKDDYLHKVNTYQSTLNLAKSINSNCKLIIFFGSIEEYGVSKLPFSEKYKPLPISVYGKEKYNAYKKIKKIMINKKTNYAWVRPSLTYGYLDKKNRFIGKIMNSLIKNQKIILRPGNQYRDLLYIDDLVKIIKLFLVHFKREYGIVNISPASKILLRDIPIILNKLVNKKNNIKLANKKSFEYDLYMDNSKLMRLFPKLKFNSLKNGLTKTLKLNKII